MSLEEVYKVSFFNFSPVIWVLIAVTVFMINYVRKDYKDDDKRNERASWFMVFICFLSIAICFTVFRHFRNSIRLMTGDYKTVQGIVKNFKPNDNKSHKYDEFTVNGIHFSYSDAEITGAFNRTAGLGGPIYPGRWVKLYYKDGQILRIDIQKAKR